MRFWIIFTILTLALLIFVGFSFIVPGGKWQINEACDGLDKKWASALTPAERILEESNPAADTPGKRTLITEPVYLEITPPRPFDLVDVSFEWRSGLKNQSLRFGVVQNPQMFSPMLFSATASEKSEDGWKKDNFKIPLSQVKQTKNGAYKFIFSSPNLSAQWQTIEIRKCSFSFFGPPPWGKITRQIFVRFMNKLSQ